MCARTRSAVRCSRSYSLSVRHSRTAARPHAHRDSCTGETHLGVSSISPSSQDRQGEQFMKRTLSLFALAVCVVSTANTAGAQASHTYTGAKACGMCHKTAKQGGQFGIWEKTKHAQAYTTLTTQKANDIAKDKGFT